MVKKRKITKADVNEYIWEMSKFRRELKKISHKVTNYEKNVLKEPFKIISEIYVMTTEKRENYKWFEDSYKSEVAEIKERYINFMRSLSFVNAEDVEMVGQDDDNKRFLRKDVYDKVYHAFEEQSFVEKALGYLLEGFDYQVYYNDPEEPEQIS